MISKVITHIYSSIVSEDLFQESRQSSWCLHPESRSSTWSWIWRFAMFAPREELDIAPLQRLLISRNSILHVLVTFMTEVDTSFTRCYCTAMSFNRTPTKVEASEVVICFQWGFLRRKDLDMVLCVTLVLILHKVQVTKFFSTLYKILWDARQPVWWEYIHEEIQSLYL
jgi:hypothetical protein